MAKWVYKFGAGSAEGRADMRELLGGKGASLHEMSWLGLPVPPGFTITTDVCTHFYGHENSYPSGLKAQVENAMKRVETLVGMTFGDPSNPLLVSVRSGARASMPGMMDTVLNLGLNDVTVEGLARRTKDARFAYDSYRRFIEMYSDVVLGLDRDAFAEILSEHKSAKGYEADTDMKADDWRAIVARYKDEVLAQSGTPFPDSPPEQLWGAIGAVFQSWMNQRAITYRRLHDIPESWGTAVNVQAMVFGNMGEDCATGVAFTRDPSTGENVFYGEYLVNAQGEDVVAGIRTPQHLTAAARDAAKADRASMEEVMPDLYRQLCDIRASLESHYRDVQDMEFTVQQGKLWMLQTRSGKRTARAAVKIAVDLVREGVITETEALMRVDPAALDQLLHPTIDPKAPRTVLAKGLPASPGAAVGAIVFSADEAEARASGGQDVILVRVETSPEDIHGMHAARGILTTRGGMTSHAAVVARGMGRPCVAGAGDIRVDYAAGTLTVNGETLRAGEVITLDGATGEVMKGSMPTIPADTTSGDFGTLMEWADKTRTLAVRANADTPSDAEVARGFGAEGIGLCRTEHMFFEPDRIVAVRRMIMAKDEAARRAALDELLPMQRSDFVGIFKAMSGLPVTIRLLDPPLHEFLPHSDGEITEVALAAGLTEDEVRRRAADMHESNPMLGHRGCRLGITCPEIYEMQARAIFEAAAEVARSRILVMPEVMLPLIATRSEFDVLKTLIDRVAASVKEETGMKISYRVGTMIELPRAALQAGSIAESADFFSFGTNDLTQTTFGLSRDDASHFLETYRKRHIIESDPFATLDREGVGELIKIAATRGRKTRKNLKLGICGEHGGDPASIMFVAEIGLDYVSCSPYRVPVARLAAAQAEIAMGSAKDSRTEMVA
ncbi:MAG TPA: pyruvate, phosphate dikinase [Alphaproteobacteria bacterium]|nr:pyruvate, phosphate dikinase [Alphaproteobacteria bacterium]